MPPFLPARLISLLILAAGAALAQTETPLVSPPPSSPPGAAAPSPEAPATPAPSPPAPKPIRSETVWKEEIFPLLQEYCTDCHDKDSQKGGVDLASLQHLPDARAALRLWWRAKDQMDAKQMPPPKKTQPTDAERDRLIAWIGDNETFLRGGAVQDPGEHRLRRLNRTEYATALHDLLGIQPDTVTDFFAEEGGGGEGFDNVGDTLFIPPVMAEQYVAAADAALAEVLRKPDLKSRLLPTPPGEALSPEEAAKATLRPLLRVAFRHSPSDETLDRYTAIATGRMKRGGSWEDGLRVAAKAVICSPDFLLLREADRPANPSAPAAVWPISGTELATRLSLFLWSSLPDAALLDEAEAGTLTQPEVLEKQTRRMLADPRAIALATNFGGQWLQFEKILTTADPDRGKYKFNSDLRRALYNEAVQFCDHLLRGGGSLLDVLDSDYTFLNKQLARHYDLPDLEGDELRLVKLTNPNRGGALGLGAVLTTTSLPRRTSPVLRGKWILEQLLGAPPPAPPPNVGTILEDDRKTKNPTIRQELQAHLRRDDCRACHARMDPLGFSLENFDPVGRWRDTLNNQNLDVTGKLPDGRAFNGPAEMKKVLLQEQDRYARNLAVKLLSYALGRGIEAADMPVIAKMEQCLKDNQFQAAPLILEIVKSLPFTHRRAQPIPIPAE
ncbi:MAG: DUF1592 domain-containing protein [Verrucomicrobiota bacterium]